MISLSGWLPVLGADDGQADLALLIDVGVVDLCLEADLGRLERILCWEVDLNAEGTFIVWWVVLPKKRGVKSKNICSTRRSLILSLNYVNYRI